MYYVIQVAPHEERMMEILLKRLLPKEVCRQCFHLTRCVVKKYHGEWHDVVEDMLPGYVFVETENVEAVREAIRRTKRFGNLLGKTKNGFFPLSEVEVAWLINLMGDDRKHKISLSRITIRGNGTIEILDGPLAQMKSLIKKFNLHKRVAELDVKIADQQRVVYLGFEII